MMLNNTKTIMEKFRENGYYVVGSGKILHHNKQELWSEFEHEADYGPEYKGLRKKERGVAHPDVANHSQKLDKSMVHLVLSKTFQIWWRMVKKLLGLMEVPEDTKNLNMLVRMTEI